jgi:hypothetical protein
MIGVRLSVFTRGYQIVCGQLGRIPTETWLLAKSLHNTWSLKCQVPGGVTRAQVKINVSNKPKLIICLLLEWREEPEKNSRSAQSLWLCVSLARVNSECTSLTSAVRKRSFSNKFPGSKQLDPSGRIKFKSQWFCRLRAHIIALRLCPIWPKARVHKRR